MPTTHLRQEVSDELLAPPAPTSNQYRRRRWFFIGGGGFLLLLLLLGLVLRARTSSGHAPAAGQAQRTVAVSLTPTVQKDVPIYLEGLGTVTALATVAVKTQVDGRLDQVVFREGQHVKKGDLLAQVDPRPFRILLQQAEGARERDAAALRNAKLDMLRYQELVTKHLIAQQQVDTQRAVVEQAEGTVQVDDAAVANAKLQLDYARISAPLDSVTGVRQVDPGNVVHASDPGAIVVLTQLDPIAVLFTLPQDELPKVARAMSDGELQVAAFNRDGSQQLATGKLLLIDNQINPTTATIRLKALFPNADHTLWPNLFVKARLLLSTRRGVMVVPVATVQHGPKGTYVYVASTDGTAELRTVEVEDTQGTQALISKGLRSGEQVVVEGQNQLSPGAHIQARPTSASAAP